VRPQESRQALVGALSAHFGRASLMRDVKSQALHGISDVARSHCGVSARICQYRATNVCQPLFTLGGISVNAAVATDHKSTISL
jgi:hypothetical protein